MSKTKKYLIIICLICILIITYIYYINYLNSIPTQSNYYKVESILNEIANKLDENENQILEITDDIISFNKNKCYKGSWYNNYIKGLTICDSKYENLFKLINNTPFSKISKLEINGIDVYAFKTQNSYAKIYEKEYVYKKGLFKTEENYIEKSGNQYIGNDGEFWYHQAKGLKLKKIINEDWAIYMNY